MKKILITTGLFFTMYLGFAPSAYGLDGLNLGARVGHMGLGSELHSTYDHALGFGLDLGFAVNSVVDVLFQSQMASHSGGVNGLKIYAETLAANMHMFQLNDFDFTAQFGPGFYFYKTAITDTRFGLNFGLGTDVLAGEHVRVGLDWRYNFVFGSGPSLDYWATMMRVSYLFTDM